MPKVPRPRSRARLESRNEGRTRAFAFWGRVRWWVFIQKNYRRIICAVKKELTHKMITYSTSSQPIFETQDTFTHQHVQNDGWHNVMSFIHSQHTMSHEVTPQRSPGFTASRKEPLETDPETDVTWGGQNPRYVYMCHVASLGRTSGRGTAMVAEGGGKGKGQRCRRFAQTRLVVRPGRGLRLPLSAYVQLHKVLLAGWTRRTASQTSGRPSGAVARQTEGGPREKVTAGT